LPFFALEHAVPTLWRIGVGFEHEVLVTNDIQLLSAYLLILLT